MSWTLPRSPVGCGGAGRHAGVLASSSPASRAIAFSACEPHGLVLEGVADGRVLLGLDDEPAGVAVLGGDLQDRREVDGALGVAGHGEDAAADAFEERQVLGLDLRGDRRADVLGVDVADAGHVFARELGRVAAAEAGVAGVEQELRRRAGVRHETVDLVRGLDDRAHVVVVDERQALRRR